jgi:hypothetical protein
MKNAKILKFVMRNSTLRAISAVVLCALVLWLTGCASYAQPGETEAEGRRRHVRNAQIEQQAMMRDLDRAMLFDKPTKLTDKRIP